MDIKFTFADLGRGHERFRGAWGVGMGEVVRMAPSNGAIGLCNDGGLSVISNLLVLVPTQHDVYFIGGLFVVVIGIVLGMVLSAGK